jgi:hypothetical protein
MFEYARYDYKNLPSIIDFGKHKSIIDVGGGFGAAIQGIKNNYPELTCALYDLEQVIEKAPVNDIIKYHGNFFDKLPENFDAIILSRVLHDWDDSNAALILKNCYQGMISGGFLYVIENCTNELDDTLSLLSLNMTAMCESYERTEDEYLRLCQQTGFIYNKSVKLNRLQTILIFKKNELEGN